MRKIVYILFFMVAAVNAQTKMSSSESATLKAKVKAHATTINTLVSDFTQYKHLDFLSNDIQPLLNIRYCLKTINFLLMMKEKKAMLI